MLKTDYKDYVASGDPKYQITANPDGSSGIKDITAYDQTGDKLGAADINATNRTVNAMGSVTLNVPLDGWTGDSAPFTQTVTVAGMTADWVPGIPMLVSTNDREQDINCQKALACVSLVSSSADALTFVCYEDKPSTDFTARIPGVI